MHHRLKFQIKTPLIKISGTCSNESMSDMLEFAPLPVSADPVVMAGVPHPIPFRTRSLSPLALMVLRLKAWESKSLPGPPKRAMCKTLNTCRQVFSLHLPPSGRSVAGRQKPDRDAVRPLWPDFMFSGLEKSGSDKS